MTKKLSRFSLYLDDGSQRQAHAGMDDAWPFTNKAMAAAIDTIMGCAYVDPRHAARLTTVE